MTIKPASFYPANPHETPWQPNRVLLFSGHMIDAPGRNPPRFPAEKTTAAAERLSSTLNELQAGPNDLALTQGACGGDILFAEACQNRGVKLQLLQPFTETEFIRNSLTPGGDNWLQRYQTIRQNLTHPPLAAPTELGALPVDMNAYERCNLWLLTSALAYGAEKLVFICLWDGGGGEGPGGTAHMVAEVKKQHGTVVWLDVGQLSKNGCITYQPAWDGIYQTDLASLHSSYNQRKACGLVLQLILDCIKNDVCIVL